MVYISLLHKNTGVDLEQYSKDQQEPTLPTTPIPCCTSAEKILATAWAVEATWWDLQNQRYIYIYIYKHSEPCVHTYIYIKIVNVVVTISFEWTHLWRFPNLVALTKMEGKHHCGIPKSLETAKSAKCVDALTKCVITPNDLLILNDGRPSSQVPLRLLWFEGG